MLDLLRTLKDAHDPRTGKARTWRQVAALLATIGGVSKSPSWWLQLASEERAPRREDENAVRRCFPGLPEVPPSAVEIVGALDILAAVVADDDPDTALLVHTGGANISQIVIKASGSVVGQPATRLVSNANIHVVKNAAHKPVVAPSFSNQDFSGLETNPRISDAARIARIALDTVPTAEDVAAWMAAL